MPEDKLRKLIRTFLAINISDYNVQKFHGSSEHGKDTIAIISENKDPLGKPQILLIQIKSGDISLSDWINRISGQMLAAFCTTEESFPPNTSKDNPRRLILFLNGELKPEAFKAIREWNRTMPVPVEVFDIFEMVRLFKGYMKFWKIHTLKIYLSLFLYIITCIVAPSLSHTFKMRGTAWSQAKCSHFI